MTRRAGAMHSPLPPRLRYTRPKVASPEAEWAANMACWHAVRYYHDFDRGARRLASVYQIYEYKHGNLLLLVRQADAVLKSRTQLPTGATRLFHRAVIRVFSQLEPLDTHE